LDAWPGAPSFHHPVAVRVGLLVASIATFLCLALPFGFVIWLPSAGFISVYLFSRRTGQSLSVRNGARMGWIAGILSFVIITVLFTIIAVGLANRPGGLPGFFREQLGNAKSIPTQDLERAIEMLANPMEQAVVYLFFLLFWFMVISFFCTAGGAIGGQNGLKIALGIAVLMNGISYLILCCRRWRCMRTTRSRSSSAIRR
jgi:hypothetical protein